MNTFLQIGINVSELWIHVGGIALTLYLIHAVGKIFHLSIGAIGSFGTYSVYHFVSLGYGWAFGVIAGAVTATLLGLLSYVLFEPFIKKHSDLLALIVSLAFLVLLESLLGLWFGSDNKQLVEGILPTYALGGVRITQPQIFSLIFGVLLIGSSCLIVFGTPMGRMLRGIAENSQSASSLAANAPGIRRMVFICTALISTAIMTLSSLSTSLQPRGSFTILVLAFIALLVGGVKSIWGLILASLIITLIPEILVFVSYGDFSLTSSWKMVIVFVLALGLLMWRPQGILSVKQRI